MCLLFLPVLFTLVHYSSGYPKGAPPQACIDISPQHYPATSQKNEVPYAVEIGQILYPNTAQENISVPITIVQEGFHSFKGFLILASEADTGSTNAAIGDWIIISNDLAKPLNCLNGGQGVTHIDKSNKTKVELKWTTSGNYKGKIKFMYAIVQRFETFWAKKETDIINIERPLPGQQPNPSSSNISQATKTTTMTTTTEEFTFHPFVTDAPPKPSNNENNSQKQFHIDLTLMISLLVFTIFKFLHL